MAERSTVLTLALDSASQEHFEQLRRKHFPPALNRIPAHLTLFHQLPLEDATAEVLREVAEAQAGFALKVTGTRSLGRGVAYTLAAPELLALHGELVQRMDEHLIPQDRQRFQPHIVVQNKVNPADARALLAELTASFEPSMVQAVGLDWWEYLGGPWKRLERFAFRDVR